MCLRGSGRGLPLQWMAAAATLIVVVGLSVLVRQGSSPEQVHPESSRKLPSPPLRAQDQHQRHRPRAAAPAPSTPPATAGQTPAGQDNGGRLERWARVVPPQYVALTTRSGQDRTTDENSRRFDEAMTHYSAGRYREAARRPPGPGGPHPARGPRGFLPRHLGVDGRQREPRARRPAAQRRLRRQPLRRRSALLSREGALRAGDLTAAARELEIAVEREAGPEGDAAKLLAELRRVK